MKKNCTEIIGILVKNKYLFQKIRLELSDFDCRFYNETEKESYSCIIVNIDDFSLPESGKIITLSANSAASLNIPFKLGELRKLLSENEKGARVKTFPEERLVSVDGERIKLTELEWGLFSLLYEKNGEFATRDELLSIWEGRAEEGILNVYIHYLREKLEKNGEKIIISSRKFGYKLSEKYL